MHSTKINGVTIHHDGDYSGNVLLVLPADKIEEAPHGQVFVEIEFDVLRKLVLNYIQGKIISKVEELDYEQLEQKLEQIIL
jgi:hypothetical protein